MRWLKITLLILSGLFTILIVVLTSKFLALNKEKTGIIFTDKSSEYSWQINTSSLKDYKAFLEKELGSPLSVEVALLPGVKFTKEASGMGDNEPAIYAEWIENLGGTNVLNIYLHKDEWNKLEESVRNRLLGVFIITELNRHLRIEQDSVQTPSQYITVYEE